MFRAGKDPKDKLLHQLDPNRWKVKWPAFLFNGQKSPMDYSYT